MSGIEARWQGLKSTLTMPHRKLPRIAKATVPVIQSLMVMKHVSKCRILPLP